MAWRKNFTEIFTYLRGDLCPPCPNGVDIAYVQTGQDLYLSNGRRLILRKKTVNKFRKQRFQTPLGQRIANSNLLILSLKFAELFHAAI